MGLYLGPECYPIADATNETTGSGTLDAIQTALKANVAQRSDSQIWDYIYNLEREIDTVVRTLAARIDELEQKLDKRKK